jgi:ABC-type branched-subunit amino acid transport system substrate-binding protein
MTHTFRHFQRGLSTWAGALLLTLVSAVQAEPGITADTITLGQSTPLSGPQGDVGSDLVRGAKVYFDALNAKGGINGRKVVVLIKDDQYDPKKTLENVEGFLSANNTFALFNVFGTQNNENLLPLAKKTGLPMLTPYSGAPSIRKTDYKGLFNLRASYADEVDKLIQHLTTVGFKKIGVAYQNNSYGKEVLNAAIAALARQNLKPVEVASVEITASDAAAATTKLLAAQPDALLLGLVGKPGIDVIKSVGAQHKGLQMYAPSPLASASNLKALGSDGAGITISQVMPFPQNQTMPLVREYQEAMRAAGQNDFTHLSLEGYVDAKVVAEGLRRTGKEPTREGLIKAMSSIQGLDLGGMEVSFGKGAASASRFVELTVITSQGKLIK